jgi:hypothetical protein
MGRQTKRARKFAPKVKGEIERRKMIQQINRRKTRKPTSKEPASAPDPAKEEEQRQNEVQSRVFYGLTEF